VVGGGEVTSGTMSPSLGVGIGMAYLPTDRSSPDTRIEIDVRGRTRPGIVKIKPLYKRED
jgi:aminomethyltransferase